MPAWAGVCLLPLCRVIKVLVAVLKDNHDMRTHPSGGGSESLCYKPFGGAPHCCQSAEFHVQTCERRETIRQLHRQPVGKRGFGRIPSHQISIEQVRFFARS